MKQPELLSAYQARIQAQLQQCFPEKQLSAAMRYSLMGRSKRLRPLLIYTLGTDLSIPLASLDSLAVAVECIHTYSLIHDDLPSMDDDDIRRGQASCHKQFDEATAILAGDALQTAAFSALLNAPISAENRVHFMQALCHAIGENGMALGQWLDMNAAHQLFDIAQLKQIHELKTGRLIAFCFETYLLAASYDEATAKALRRVGDLFGLAFQVQDDILDITKTTDELGKPACSDLVHEKATYPQCYGLEKSQYILYDLRQELLATMSALPFPVTELSLLTQWIFPVEVACVSAG